MHNTTIDRSGVSMLFSHRRAIMKIGIWHEGEKRLKRSMGWLALALFGSLVVCSSGVGAANIGQIAAPDSAQRPTEAFAFNSVAVIRLLMTYSDQQTANPAPLACTGLGTIVATTGAPDQMDGGATRTFVLTDSSIVS